MARAMVVLGVAAFGCGPSAAGGDADAGTVTPAGPVGLRVTSTDFDRQLLREDREAPETRYRVVVTISNTALTDPLRFTASSLSVQTVDSQEIRGRSTDGSCAASTTLLRGDSVTCAVEFRLPHRKVPRRLLLTGLGGGSAVLEVGPYDLERELGTQNPCERRYGVANSFICDECLAVFCRPITTAWVDCGGRAAPTSGQNWVREACTSLAPVQAMCPAQLDAVVTCMTTMCTAACVL